MAFYHRAIMSGERTGPVASLMRGGLWIASLAYRVGASRRNQQFESGKREVCKVDAPVISVGNLTTGGTGKTPVVCALATMLRRQGKRVAIVSRGYGSGDQDFNDEALELHDRLPDVPHIQDPDRVAAAEVAVDELESEVVIMDDGFQHRRLHRDLNLVVVDAKCPFGFGHLLPRGLLREPLDGFRRADLVILSRCSLVDETTIKGIKEQIASINDAVPILLSDHRPAYLRTYPDHESTMESLAGKRVAMVCAIGNPDAFAETITGCGAEVVQSRHLPDHDPYAPETVAELRDWVRSIADQIDVVVCTHKDLVKLRTDRLGGKPLQAIVIELEWLSDVGPLEELIAARVE